MWEEAQAREDRAVAWTRREPSIFLQVIGAMKDSRRGLSHPLHSPEGTFLPFPGSSA